MKLQFFAMVTKDLVISRYAKQLFTNKIGANYVRTVAKQYIEESCLPTRAFQKSLPHLFVPNLNQSVIRYLVSQACLV